jgi:protein scribble
LKIGGKDVTDWTHAEVIRALSEPRAQQIILNVRHDPPPEGLDEFLIHRNENEQYGVKIVGGVREHASYSNRVYDSGIFVSKVIRGGAIARDGRLKVNLNLFKSKIKFISIQNQIVKGRNEIVGSERSEYDWRNSS